MLEFADKVAEHFAIWRHSVLYPVPHIIFIE